MKQIQFNYNGVDYTLEFTRRTVQILESRGFNIHNVDEKPVTGIPTLWAGAFLAHHPSIKQELVNEIYKHITDKVGLVNKLIELYAEPMNTLLDDPEEAEGNVSWEANF